MTGLNADSRRLLETVFGPTMDGAWLTVGQHDAADKMTPLAYGPVGIDLPDDKDIYYCVGRIKPGAKRDDDGVDKVMVLVVDDVGKEIDKGGFDMMFPLKPSFIVESSRGSFQYGYIIEGGMDPEDYKALRRAMKASPIWGKAHNTAPSAIYRLPQGTHTKKSRLGWKARQAAWAGHAHKEEDIWAGLAHGAPPVVAASTGRADLVENEELLAKLVEMIPNPAEDWEFFVNVGRAIWGASGGAAYEVFERWADKCPTANPVHTQGRWASYPSTGSRIGRYWLLREARAAGGDVEGWLKEEAGAVFDEVDDMGLLSPRAPVEAAITPHHRTVAWEVEKKVGARMRFNHDSGCWHTFGSTWAAQPGSVRVGFNEAWRWVNQNIVGMTKPEVKQVSKADFFSGVETILKQRLAIRHVDFDRDPWLLGTPGGTVDLRTGKLRPAEPGEFISKSTAVTPLEVSTCPRWKKFILEITKNDTEAATFLQQWAGYCLTGDTTEQVFLFLYGPGGNGKSVLMDTLGRLMGDYFVKPVADLYFAKQGSRHMQEVAMLAGARMVTVSEVPPNAAWDEGKLKDHTGGGLITANFMRQNSFSFVPQFKLTALGNHQPSFPGGMNAAIKRRFRLMMLDYKPAHPDPDLMDSLWNEKAGILRWCIEGLTDPANGWNRIRLMEPLAVKDATKAYVHDQDVFGLWIEERIQPSKGGKASATDLFNDWNEWRHANGGSDLVQNLKAFSLEMQQRDYKAVRTNSFRGFAGISLKTKVNSPF